MVKQAIKELIQHNAVQALDRVGSLAINSNRNLYFEELVSMIKVNRIWCNFSRDLELILKRPRVDCRISEYVVDCIYKTIPQLDKILIKNDYNISLSFDYKITTQEDNEKNISLYGMSTAQRLEAFGYFTDWDYNTDDTEYWIHGKRSTLLNIVCNSVKFNENITPREYADLVHNMVSVLLKRWYKRVTKEIMDESKSGMDYAYIESFCFPAAFENQKYSDDLVDNYLRFYNREAGNVVPNLKEAYKNHYKEQ